MDSDTAPIAVLSLKSRSPIRLAYDESLDGAADMLAQVRGEDRQYGSLGLLVREKSRRSGTGTVEWTEIYVQPGAGAPRLLTACDGDRCGQPALSPDAGRVAFVRKAAASPR